MAFLLAGGAQGKLAQLSERELQEAMAEGAELVKAQTVEKDFVIVKSTSKYEADGGDRFQEATWKRYCVTAATSRTHSAQGAMS